MHNRSSPPIVEAMILKDLDAYFSDLLDIPSYVRIDASLNGLQVGDLQAEVRKVAFAVDACQETFRRARQAGADLLFVHHGLFWGKPAALTGSLYERIRLLMEGPLALYAAHLPLDLHAELGNNAALARRMGLEEVEPFGIYNGVKIGFKGILPQPLGLDDALDRLGLTRETCLSLLPFGGETISRVAVVSGGAATEVYQALDEEVDLYITGEVSHQIYHHCLEGGIHFAAGGHYLTETYGVREVARRVSRDLGLETEFIDVPTGL